MGAFFTNVQVFTEGRPTSEAREVIAQALSAAAREAGFIEIEASSAEPADRTIIIGATGNPRWIAVYDESTEDQNLDKLESLAATLSRTLDTAAVAVLVHDSDVLDLRLVKQGARVDTYCSYPEYFGGRNLSAKKRAALAGHPEAWKELLAAGKTEDDLKAVFSEKKLFAEATLARVAELLGMDLQAAATGYRYLDRDAQAAITLRFRLAQRPAHERSAEGPPAFTLGGHTPTLALSVGDALRVHVQVQSTGGASRGLLVSVWGDTLETGLVEAERVQVTVGNPRSPSTFEAPLVDGKAGAGQRLRYARFDDVEIPAGLAGGGFPDMRGGNMQQAMDAWFERQVRAFVEGRVTKAGKAKLAVGLVPLANVKEGAAGCEMELVITSPPRRPLRAAPDAESHLLRPLASPSQLFALLTLGASREAVADLARTAFERWGRTLAKRGEGRYETALFEADPTSRPKTGSRKSTGFFSGKWWKEMQATLATCRIFSATLRDPGASEGPHHALGGFALATTLFPRPIADEPLPHLLLWIDLAGVDADEARRAEDELIAFVDEAMERASGLQAMVGRWNISTTLGMTADITPYEQASGVSGQVTTWRSWCSRFLRGVPERALWLGPELIARLGDTDPLATIAKVTPVGGGVRIELRAPADIGALEQALAALLPGANDWQKGVRALYAGP